MEVLRKDIDKLNAELTIKISENDYKEKVESSLRKYRKQAKMPGFRQGMVPMGMIKKMVGTNILVEEINKVLSDSLYNYIGENKIDILGNPLPKIEEGKNIDWDNQKDFDFVYELGLSPEIKVSISDKDKFDLYKVKVDDKMIKEQINQMASRFGKMQDVDKAEKGDMLYGKFNELEKGAIKEGGIFNSTVINTATISKEKDQKMFLGLKVGDVVTVKPQKIAEANYVAAWLGIQQEEVAAIKSEFSYTIEKVSRMEPAELNQELFDKLYGKDVIKSEVELENKIKEEMEKSFEQNSSQLFEREVQDYLIKKAKLNLPDAFMKKWLKTANEKPITDEQIESEYEQYAMGLRWQLIENKLIKDNDIKVEKAEVIEHTKGLIAQQLGGMGQGVMGDAEMEETANRVLENQEEAKRVYEQVYQLKMRDLYKNTVKIKEKEISYDEFVKLAEKKSK